MEGFESDQEWSDHPRPDGTFDLHVHVYKNEYKNRRLLGRYRLPGLQPVFASEPELNERETRELLEWLAAPAINEEAKQLLEGYAV